MIGFTSMQISLIEAVAFGKYRAIRCGRWLGKPPRTWRFRTQLSLEDSMSEQKPDVELRVDRRSH